MKTSHQLGSREINTRTLKIHYKCRSRYRDVIRVPAIRLEGKWLDALGFSEGKKVQIEITAGKLTIHLIQEAIIPPQPDIT